MAKILIEFEERGYASLKKIFDELERSNESFNSSIQKTSKSVKQSSSELSNLAKLNERIARIQAQQAKGIVSAGQAQVGITKAKIVACQREIQILNQQNASQMKLAAAQQKLAALQVKLANAEKNLLSERQKILYANDKVTASIRNREIAEQKANVQAQLSAKIAQSLNQQAKGRISAEQAAVNISRAKIAAIQKEIQIEKASGAEKNKIAKLAQKLAGEELKLMKAKGKLAAETDKSTKAVSKLGDAFGAAVPAAGNLRDAIVGGLVGGATVKGIEAIGLAIGKLREYAIGSVEEFANLDESLTTFRAVAGVEDSSKEFRAVEAEVKRLGATTTYTASEVGSLAVELSKAGLDASQVEGALEGVSLAAIASGTDLGEMGEIIVRAVDGFSELNRDSAGFSKAADILVTAANASSTSVSEIGEALKAVGPLASQAGLTLEETSRFFALFASAGVTGAEAGTALKGTLALIVPAIEGLKGNIEGLNPTQQGLVQTLKDLGYSYNDFLDSAGGLDGAKAIDTLSGALASLETPTEKAKFALQAFGLEYGSKVLGLITRSKDTISAQAAAFDNLAGTAGRTAAVMQSSFSSQLKILESSISGLKVEIGSTLAGAFLPLIKEAGAFFTDLTSLFTDSGFSTGIRNFLLETFSGIGQEFNNFISTIDVSVFFEIFEKIKPILATLFESLGNLDLGARFGELANAFGSLYKEVYSILGKDIQNAIGALGNGIGVVIDAVNFLIQAFVDLGLARAVLTPFSVGFKVITAAVDTLAGLIAGIQGFLEPIVPILANISGPVIATLTGAVSSIFGVIQQIGAGIAFIGNQAQRLGSTVGGGLRDLIQFFYTKLGQIINLVEKITGFKLPDFKIGIGKTNVADDLGKELKGAEKVYARAVAELGDAATTAWGKEQIKLKLAAKGFGDVDLKELENKAKIKKFVDISEGVKDLNKASVIVSDAIKELGDAAETEVGRAEIKARLASAGFGDLAFADIQQASTELGQAELLMVRAIESLGDNATAAMREDAVNQVLKQYGEFANLPKEKLEETKKRILEGATALEIETKKAGDAAASGIKEGTISQEEALTENQGKIEEGLNKLKETYTAKSLEIQKQLSSGKLTETEANFKTAENAEKQAAEELAVLRKNNANKQDIIDAELKLEEARARKIEASREDSLAKIAKIEQEGQLAIQKELNSGKITESEAESRRAQLAENTAAKELEVLKSSNASKQEILEAELKLEEARANKINAVRSAALEAIAQTEKEGQLKIQKELDSGAISEPEAELKRAELAEQTAVKELEILKSSKASKSEIIDAEIKLEEARANKVAAIREQAISKVEAAEQQRLIDIAKLEASGLASTEQIEQLKAKSGVEAARAKLAALKQVGASEEELNQATLDLLAAEKDAQESLIGVIDARIDSVKASIEATAEAATKVLEQQIQADELRSNALNRQISILDSINSLESARADLISAQSAASISKLSRAEEAKKILEDENASIEEQKAAKAELAQLGFDSEAKISDIIKQRQAEEDAAAKRQLEALQQQFAFARQKLELENQSNIAAAKRAVIEAQILAIQSQAAAIQARIDQNRINSQIAQIKNQLAAAQSSGNAAEAAALQVKLDELNAQKQLNDAIQKQAELTQQAVVDAQANVSLAEQQAKMASEQLALEQQAELIRAYQAENERRLDAARERVAAGLDRGEVELLPVEGELDLGSDRKAQEQLNSISRDIENTNSKITEKTSARIELNQIEIEQQERLLQLEKARAALMRNSGGNTVDLPAFKKGGSFEGVKAALVGEAGPEIVDFTGKRGYIYDALKTSKIINQINRNANDISIKPQALVPEGIKVNNLQNSELTRVLKTIQRELKRSRNPIVINQRNETRLDSLTRDEFAKKLRQEREKLLRDLDKFI